LAHHALVGTLFGLVAGMASTWLVAFIVARQPPGPPARADIDRPGDRSGVVVLGAGMWLVPVGTLLGLTAGITSGIVLGRRAREARPLDPD
jgi:hypothetical protein